MDVLCYKTVRYRTVTVSFHYNRPPSILKGSCFMKPSDILKIEEYDVEFFNLEKFGNLPLTTLESWQY